MKRLLFIFGFIFLSQSSSAQVTIHKMLHVGYVYQNQSFAELGGRLLFLNNDDFIYRVGASALVGSTNSKFAILPKLQGDILINTERNVDVFHSYYFLAGAEATSKYIAPKIGASLFGIIDLTGGYAFPFSGQTVKGKELKGFNLNFTINLPLTMLHDLLN
ncbi:hypothetical protein [Halpernia frigidisoli]|uniref:Uncharacterized protein n=1 Tax=Halpernia frigidisoli TaxID=1125876 RepID=A0A1I3I5X3_9FLAO|nr:hypothetical protein SAMN05443292_2575 [Halpernia frigidisoli]